jgi:hypothetical protein
MTDPTDTDHGTHAQHVPSEFIPEGYIQITNYTEEELPALAEDIAADADATPAEILETLEDLVHEYNVPVVEADRSARVQYGEKQVSVIEDPDPPKKYGWDP